MENINQKVGQEDLFKRFTRQVVEIFHNKRERKSLDGENGRVVRGRSPASSSDLEDLLALTISGMLGIEYRFLVDKAISYKTPEMKRAKIIYPDIMIIRGDTLLGIIELKIDLGYLSDDWIDKYLNNIVELARVGVVTYKEPKEYGKSETRKLKIARDIHSKSKVVVITSNNNHGKLEKFVQATNATVLYDRETPTNNKYNKSNREVLMESLIKEKDTGWKALETFLRKF